MQNATKQNKNVNKNATNLAINHVKRLKLVNKNVINLVIKLKPVNKNVTNLVKKLKLVNKNVKNLVTSHQNAKLKQKLVKVTTTKLINTNMKVATININQK